MRKASITRNTLETKINISINLDGTGLSKLNTGIPFFEHMLEQVARHGMLDLDITSDGDIHIDNHHSVEDVGIVLGQAFKSAVGNKNGIQRYGNAYVPLDEALSRVVIDLSGRSGLTFNANFTRENIGDFDTELVYEFFQGFVNHACVTLHIDCIRGNNAHHQAETIFKAFGRALRMALSKDERLGNQLASTKGLL